MGIKIPRYHILPTWDLPSLRRHLKGGSRRQMESELNLTSMIDLFSVLILFLLSTFSATGQIILADTKISLPLARSAYLVQRAPIVTVTENGVVLEGAGVGTNADIEEKVEEIDWELPLMKERLRSYRDFFEEAEPGVPFPAEVILQADKSLSFLYIKRVMYTLVSEGYTNINLLVQGEANLRRSAEEVLEEDF